MSTAFEEDHDGYVYTRGLRAWSATDLVHQETQILPLDDVIAHELDEGCICGPSVSVVVTGEAGGWGVVKHHGLLGN